MAIPPPEYLNAANGGRANRTGPTLDGFSPAMTWGMVGRPRRTIAGKAEAIVGARRVLRRDRGVTGFPLVQAACGTFQDVSMPFTSASSDMRPSCTAFSTAIANTALLTDAAWSSVAVVMGRPLSTSAMP